MAKKSKKRRKVLAASCILAALIVAGSSFAWFTSKDEVTNRLSATANYGVTIAEDFTPPENWLPGQKVDKNVGVVNTGNVDAFVRTWLEGEMTVLAEKRDTQKWDDATGIFTDGAGTPNNTLLNTSTVGAAYAIANLTKETDTDLIANDLTYYYMPNGSTDKDDKISLKELRQDLYLNPNSPITSVSSPEGYSDVMAVQAGGELVYVNSTDSKFSFKFTPNQTINITSAGTGAVGGITYDINGGTPYTVNVGTALTSGDDIEVSGTDVKVKDLDTFYKYLGNNIDTNYFEPMTTGLYIFKRNTNEDANQYPDYEYTGYYYVATTGDTGAQGKFFALQYENDGTQRSDYVLEKDTYSVIRDNTGKETFVPYRKPGAYGTGSTAAVQVGTEWYDASTGFKLTGGSGTASGTAKSVTLFTAQKQVVENSALTWVYAEKAAATPTDGDTVTIGTDVYTYDGSTDNRWEDSSNGAVTGDTLTAVTTAFNKLGSEVEDNGKLYTFKNGTGGAGWYYDNSGTETIETNTALVTRLDSAVTNSATLTATWKGVDGDVATTADNISVIVNLTNIGTDPEKWTRIVAGTDKVDTFYYNNDVEEGATTAKLVDSVELDQNTTKNAYIAFDFDLNVNMESVQVTINDNGKEAFESVTSWTATSGSTNMGATGTHNGAQSGTEIDKITWTAS